MRDLIFNLCNDSNFAEQELSNYAKVKKDNNGNIIGEIGNITSNYHIMLDAHIDKVGFIVTYIKDSFIKIAKCGGIDPKIMPGSVMLIHGKKDVKGIVCCMPPHLIKDEDNILDIEDLYIDTGLSVVQTKSLISVGDQVSFYSEPKMLLNNRVSASSLDNKAGVAALLRVAKVISKMELNCRVSIVLSSFEETTGCGAKTASFKISPNEAIAVDVSFASQPDIPDEKCGKLSGGPMIGVSPILSQPMYRDFISIASKNDIPYQIEPMGGRTGTNADDISVSKEGVKSGLISIPLRYMHTPREVIDVSDIKNTAKLIVSYIKHRGELNV